MDCELLKEVYINLIDQKEPKLNLENEDVFNIKLKNGISNSSNKLRKIIKPSSEELKLHSDYKKNQLKKNFFS